MREKQNFLAENEKMMKSGFSLTFDVAFCEHRLGIEGNVSLIAVIAQIYSSSPKVGVVRVCVTKVPPTHPPLRLFFNTQQDKAPRRTADGFEEAVGVNHLGHFLLCNLLIDELKKSRVVFIGTETHNPGSIAGKIPPQASESLRRMEESFRRKEHWKRNASRKKSWTHFQNVCQARDCLDLFVVALLDIYICGASVWSLLPLVGADFSEHFPSNCCVLVHVALRSVDFYLYLTGSPGRPPGSGEERAHG